MALVACRILFVNSHHLLTSLFAPPIDDAFPVLIVIDVPLAADVVDVLVHPEVRHTGALGFDVNLMLDRS